ncbi:hypothetical protein L228DRAFT_238101 [Xylona heveae TC161]|uniref:Uncharacterized protein n=1 Tax=Xylona heveae (strain CBS 132557 / TC161) TaxID=1328760 RepID=A0A165HHX6_XYLHT|nr:hypothetical protein L228DRAFT_238101 [Xylona heveae TC161]KZF23545.1 hypothetical protein L228DRAFT_238101 [Xylona heveae TC161]
MHRDRASPIIGPTSPHSTSHMNSAMFSTSSRAKRKAPSNPLRLPSLPRFHPAVYQSPSTSASNTPASELSTPHAHAQRQISEAQRQLYAYQRELMGHTFATRDPVRQVGTKPASPKLVPLGSPGPVTPLMLEEEGGYFIAGATSVARGVCDEAAQRELVERLICQETTRERQR